jgi:hypothetical protein
MVNSPLSSLNTDSTPDQACARSVRQFGPVQAGPSKFKPTQLHHLAITVPKKKRCWAMRLWGHARSCTPAPTVDELGPTESGYPKEIQHRFLTRFKRPSSSPLQTPGPDHCAHHEQRPGHSFAASPHNLRIRPARESRRHTIQPRRLYSSYYFTDKTLQLRNAKPPLSWSFQPHLP